MSADISANLFASQPLEPLLNSGACIGVKRGRRGGVRTSEACNLPSHALIGRFSKYESYVIQNPFGLQSMLIKCHQLQLYSLEPILEIIGHAVIAMRCIRYGTYLTAHFFTSGTCLISSVSSQIFLSIIPYPGHSQHQSDYMYCQTASTKCSMYSSSGVTTFGR